MDLLDMLTTEGLENLADENEAKAKRLQDQAKWLREEAERRKNETKN